MHLFCSGPLTVGYNESITTCSYSDKRYSVNKNEVKNDKLNNDRWFRVSNNGNASQNVKRV